MGLAACTKKTAVGIRAGAAGRRLEGGAAPRRGGSGAGDKKNVRAAS
jgi:hypothetical protein